MAAGGRAMARVQNQTDHQRRKDARERTKRVGDARHDAGETWGDVEPVADRTAGIGAEAELGQNEQRDSPRPRGHASHTTQGCCREQRANGHHDASNRQDRDSASDEAIGDESKQVLPNDLTPEWQLRQSSCSCEVKPELLFDKLRQEGEQCVETPVRSEVVDHNGPDSGALENFHPRSDDLGVWATSRWQQLALRLLDRPHFRLRNARVLAGRRVHHYSSKNDQNDSRCTSIEVECATPAQMADHNRCYRQTRARRKSGPVVYEPKAQRALRRLDPFSQPV
mmetsp:Transcript_42973/g.93361  ORF Transcript_42973/g.93361 Transcript_42973/m.93361 type:complete len:282 (+) Transcript_42973:265-1110(+)